MPGHPESAISWLRRSRVRSPPAAVVQRLGLSPFYAKFVNVMGLAIVGSADVLDAALLEAGYLAHEMLQNRPDVARRMAARKVRIAVMAVSEYTTDVPEHGDLTPAADWDRRARGLGATDARPASSCGEENLLGCPGDPYAGECIHVHELAHSVHLMALRHLDPSFEARLDAAYDAAVAAGRWLGTYAATSREEYWAEGVQSYFGCNPRVPNDFHNDVDTRAELRRYDATLCRLIADQFGRPRWKYLPPTSRTHQPHLASLDRTALPTFTWPGGRSRGGRRRAEAARRWCLAT
jgi:hypothetical protein